METQEQLDDHQLEQPEHIAAEVYLISALFEVAERKPEWMDSVLEIVTPADFVHKRNKRVFSVMAELFNKNESFDVVNVRSVIPGKEMGTDQLTWYISPAVSDYVATYDIPRYAKLIKQASERRQVINAAEKILEIAKSGEDVQDLFDEAQEILSKAEPTKIVKSGPVPITELLLPYFEELELAYTTAQNGGVQLGIATQMMDFDMMTNGLQRKDLIIVAARPSMGKTAYALNVLQGATSKEKVYGILFSGEMSKDKPLIDRIVGATGRVELERLKTGMLDADDWARVTRAIGNLTERLLIDDTASMSIAHIRRESRKVRRRIGPDADLVIVVDYLQLIKGPKSNSRYEEVSAISRELKALAREVNAPVIALSQLSRSVEQRQNKRPMMSDLRESGQIEQDADVIAFLYRDDYYNPESERKNITEIIIAKQRNGSVGTVEMLFMKKFGAFVNLERAPGA